MSRKRRTTHHQMEVLDMGTVTTTEAPVAKQAAEDTVTTTEAPVAKQAAEDTMTAQAPPFERGFFFRTADTKIRELSQALLADAERATRERIIRVMGRALAAAKGGHLDPAEAVSILYQEGVDFPSVDAMRKAIERALY